MIVRLELSCLSDIFVSFVGWILKYIDWFGNMLKFLS